MATRVAARAGYRIPPTGRLTVTTALTCDFAEIS